jgi:hypothetical protein
MQDAATDLDLIRPLNGLHVGQLTITELEALGRLVRAGLAGRDYSGVAGFLGLPRVMVYSEPSSAAALKDGAEASGTA